MTEPAPPSDDQISDDQISDELRAQVEMLARAARLDVEIDRGWIVARRRSDGHDIVRATGTDTLFVRAGDHPAVLHRDPGTSSTPDGFVALDPWPQDFTFARGVNVLRDAVIRASRT